MAVDEARDDHRGRRPPSRVWWPRPGPVGVSPSSTPEVAPYPGWDPSYEVLKGPQIPRAHPTPLSRTLDPYSPSTASPCKTETDGPPTGPSGRGSPDLRPKKATSKKRKASD